MRVDTDLWVTFGDAIKRADPETDRSAFLRMVMRWAAADPYGAMKTIREHIEKIDKTEGG